jgi:RND superfamily putative drug exporter
VGRDPLAGGRQKCTFGGRGGFGVLLDTFVVRSLVVPAAVTLLGDRVWWPSRLARRRPDPEPERELEPV